MLNPAPILVIGIGNPSRGDDALGPNCIERLAALALPDVDLVGDFQLQVEFALDLVDRRRVIFVDAAASGPGPFAHGRVRPRRDPSFTSHQLSAAAVLYTFEQLYGVPPETWLLAIRGYRFELGEDLTPQAAANLDAALDWLLTQGLVSTWENSQQTLDTAVEFP